MPPELLALGVLFVVLLLAAIVTLAVVRHAPRSLAAQSLGRGDFAAALAAADLGPAAEREELYAAAVAAKHLLRLEEAEELLERILAADARDGEAWLERGLVAAYRDDLGAAEEALSRAAEVRSDLAESVALHRAWVLLRAGRADEARRLFEEIEAPLDSKLRVDLGPGDPLFCEWFLQAAALWKASGADERADWARREGLRSAPASALAARLAKS